MQAFFDVIYDLVILPIGVALFFIFDLAILAIFLLYLYRFVEWLLDRR